MRGESGACLMNLVGMAADESRVLPHLSVTVTVYLKDSDEASDNEGKA